ncbi:kinase-like domain-containing protein [Xylaria sp. FL1042]|nr:kinase-like domain-containing protein [Xylaria sp. FL1042]
MATQTLPESTFYPIVHDDLFNASCIRKNDVWEKKLLSSSVLRLLEVFVSGKMGNRYPVEFVMTAKGSYNLTLKFRIGDGATPEYVALRFPQRGYAPRAFVTEKVENEVRWMQYFEEKHIAPVPHIYSWHAKSGPDEMDPYILMDFVEGENLNTCLARWEASASASDEEKKRFAFQQLATILLELNCSRFDKIGSITKAADGSWAVTRRPLTYDMYMCLTSIPDFATDTWPTEPLQTAQEYKAFVADMSRQRMMCLRNINIPGTWDSEGFFTFQQGENINMERAMATARGRLRACRAMDLPDYAAYLNTDNGPFTIFCPDLSNFDIVADPVTGQIKALLDLEFTNAMPAAFTQDPPIWISAYSLSTSLQRGFLPTWQKYGYKPRFDAFLTILEQVEASSGKKAPSPPLSARMRASWDSGTYLVNYALNKSSVADHIYYKVLVQSSLLQPSVPLKEIKEYQEHTRR